MKKKNKRRTLKHAFSCGFLAGMAVVHSISLEEQEMDYFKAWKRGDEHWCKKTLEKYQKIELEEY